MIFCAGLTGGFAAGKTSAAEIFSELGAEVIDADDAGRALTAPNGKALPSLRKALGDWAFNSEGEFDRKKVRARVFADETTRRRLEKALHPQIEMEMRRRIAAAKDAPYVILSAPLLFETGVFAGECRRVVAVDCCEETQIARAVKRGGITDAEARAVLAAQMPRAERISRADGVINNEGGRRELRRAVLEFHKQFMQLSQERKTP